MATPAALIGSFSIFWFHEIGQELLVLKDLILDREYAPNQHLRQHFTQENYCAVEQIYDNSALALQMLSTHSSEIAEADHDIAYLLAMDHLANNQPLYDRVKKSTQTVFTYSMVLIFVSQVALLSGRTRSKSISELPWRGAYLPVFAQIGWANTLSLTRLTLIRRTIARSAIPANQRLSP